MTLATTVRLAKPEDALAIGRIHVAGWRYAYAGLLAQEMLDALDPAARAQEWRDVLERRHWPGTTTLVASREGAILGFAAAGGARDDDLDRFVVGEIYAIYADPEAIGTGVGAALMRASLSFFRAHGFRTASLWALIGNDGARAFYERFGFALDGARKPFRDAFEIRFRRRLA